MKRNKTVRTQKRLATHMEKKWKSTFRACEINSLFQFRSMDILNFYALCATYVLSNQQHEHQKQKPKKKQKKKYRTETSTNKQTHAIQAKIREPIKRSMNIYVPCNNNTPVQLPMNEYINE